MSQPLSRLGDLTPGLRTFVVVDAVLVLTFLALLVVQLVGAGSATPPDDAAATSVAPESTPDATAPDAPDDAEELTAFVLPSGNIWCQMSTTSATCTILQFTYTTPAVPEGCEGTAGNVLTVTAGERAAMACVTEPVEPAPEGTAVLEYGQASTVGEMTCHSSTNGATCRHNPTGEGFSLARAGYTIL